jgi:hypothetical protein
MAFANGSLDSKLERLRQLRNAFLRLHKALLEAERLTYEQIHGRVESNSQFFQLVISDEWFAWLRPFSQFIVFIDETMASKEPVTLEQVNPLFGQAKALLSSEPDGTPAEQKYHDAIQRDSDIAYMHVEAMTLLRNMV